MILFKDEYNLSGQYHCNDDSNNNLLWICYHIIKNNYLNCLHLHTISSGYLASSSVELSAFNLDFSCHSLIVAIQGGGGVGQGVKSYLSRIVELPRNKNQLRT